MPKNRQSTAHTTTDHNFIKNWVESRQGHPAKVKGTGEGEDSGLLRIDFPGYSGNDALEEIAWEEFFKKFEEAKLAFLYQEETPEGEPSNFNKLVLRKSAA